MGKYVALLRGINVGKAKRVAMADLRHAVESLGGTAVQTVLNSGNVCFQSSTRKPAALAPALKAILKDRLQVDCAVQVFEAGTFRAILAANPMPQSAEDPARFLVAFVASPEALAPIRECLPMSCPPDCLAVGDGAAYLWCASGILESPVFKLVTRVAGDTITTRNWSTLQRLLAVLDAYEA